MERGSQKHDSRRRRRSPLLLGAKELLETEVRFCSIFLKKRKEGEMRWLDLKTEKLIEINFAIGNNVFFKVIYFGVRLNHLGIGKHSSIIYKMA